MLADFDHDMTLPETIFDTPVEIFAIKALFDTTLIHRIARFAQKHPCPPTASTRGLTPGIASQRRLTRRAEPSNIH
jgi:hypothetical protein